MMNSDAYEKKDVADEIHETSPQLAEVPAEDVAAVTYNYVLNAEDWRRAADTQEISYAFDRKWRVPAGCALVALGSLLMFINIILGKLLGVQLIAISIIAAWRPLYQDLHFWRLLRRRIELVLTVDVNGITVISRGSPALIKWNKIRNTIEGVDGILVNYVVGAFNSPRCLWIPARIFTSSQEQVALTDLMSKRGVNRKAVGSG
jgi:hypothetical protein